MHRFPATVRRCISIMTLVCGWLLVAVVASGADEAQRNSDGEAALARGIAYLVEQQGDDGGWHSTTYGQLKEGPALTALVLDALSLAPARLRGPHETAIEQGFTFFAPGMKKRGTLAAPNGTLDFPTYAAPLWLASRARLQLAMPVDERRQLTDYLIAAQLTEARGFDAAHPAYGGWDFLGGDDAQGITTGTSISVAAYVLEGLRSEKDDPRLANVRKRALGWLERCQQDDGGLAFTPEPGSLANKADYRDAPTPSPRSYGTATCDGIAALAACGVPSDDPRIMRAVKWLVERPALDVVPGFEHLPPENDWQRGLRYYYYASLARVLPHFPDAEAESRRRGIVQILIQKQQKNGSWTNPSQRMREDDPLVATSFAVTALGRTLTRK